MTATDINRYIGLPYAAGGRGPAYDCWGLLMHLQREFFGVDLPEVGGNWQAAALEYSARRASGAWLLLPTPEHGAPALLRGGLQPHVGTWLAVDGGGVLHAQEGAGVVWTPAGRLNLAGYGRAQYFKVKHEGNGRSHH